MFIFLSPDLPFSVYVSIVLCPFCSLQYQNACAIEVLNLCTYLIIVIHEILFYVVINI